MQYIAVLICLIVLIVMSGCITIAGIPSIHSLSEVTEPTFCLHRGSEPRGITRLRVIRGDKVNDERIEWLESGDTWLWEGPDQKTWILEYAPDTSDPRVKPFSCITYGKAPPGYKEKLPAVPLTPERLYYVEIETSDAVSSAEMFFITRLDPMGRPFKLEYTSSLNHEARDVKVITR